MALDHEDNIILITYCIWLGFLTFIYTPIILYYCRALWKMNQKISSFSKRYPRYVIVCCLAMLLHMLVLRTIADLPSIMMFYYGDDRDIDHCIRIIFYDTIHAVYIMAVVRSWLLFVEYKKANQLMVISWQKKIIDITKPDFKIPWALRYSFLRFDNSLIIRIIFLFVTVLYVYII